MVTMKLGSVCTSATWRADPSERSGELSCSDTLDLELEQRGMLSKELTSNLLLPSFAMVK